MKMSHIIKPLDRYVFNEFWWIFVTTALGFPVLLIVIDITDNLNTYLQRNLPKSQKQVLEDAKDELREEFGRKT